MQAYLDKNHRQQNKEILIKHSPIPGECFLFSNIQLAEKIKIFHQGGCKIYDLHLLNMCKDIFEPSEKCFLQQLEIETRREKNAI